MRKENLLQEIKELEQQMIADRRFLHQHPELSHQEYQTTRFVKERLAQFGLQPEPLETDTGVSVLIRGGKPGKTIQRTAKPPGQLIELCNFCVHVEFF